MNRTTLTFSLILVSIISLLSLSGCQIATPLKSVASKELDPNAELLVVETHAKSGQQGHGEVYRQTGKLLDTWRDSMEGQPGMIGHSIRRTIGGEKARTMTIWEDEASINAFVRGATHRTAVREKQCIHDQH